MELFSPSVPKVAIIGHRAAPDSQPLTWLEQNFEVLVYPEDRVEAALPDLSQVQVVLIDADSAHARKTCQRLREAGPAGHLPLLCVGRRLEAQDVLSFFSEGIDDYVTLPVERSILLAKIRALASRQIESTVKRAINRALARDLEGMKALFHGRAPTEGNRPVPPHDPGHGSREVPDDRARTGPKGKELLGEIERRTAALPEHVALFVISALASTKLLPLNLSSLILNSLTHRIPLSKLGPIHHAFADLVKRHMTSTSQPGAQSGEMAMLKACGSSEAAVDALRFVAELPSSLQRGPAA